jgi:tetratricopeptide (TPR) repeat protein
LAIDRTAILRNAETLARQGKLESAAAEYRRVVDDNPRDWTTANTLGDLYLRLQKTDKAVEQFTRIADHLAAEGFLPRAGALYKKILKLKPDDEQALVQMAEIARGQGLIADARAYLTTVLERRQGRRDKKGVADVRVRLGALDPSDIDTRLVGARARADVGDVKGAVRDLQEIAADLTKQGKEPDAFKLLQEAARLDPRDRELRGRIARAAVARGDLAVASQYLTAEIAGDDPDLLMVVAGIGLRSQTPEGEQEGLAIAGRLLEHHPERREQVARLAWSVARERPDAAYAVMRLIVDATVTRGDATAAASALQEFARHAPAYIPALLRLMEVSIEAGLESIMHSAQAQLADAYLAAGMAAEALFLAEDLVAREPWEPANIERLRMALELSGEPDPTGLIAERLSGRQPFMTTDVMTEESYFPPEAAGAEVEPPAPPPAPASAPAATAHAEAETVEVDLSIVLDEGDAPPPAAPAAEPPPADEAADLEQVFARLRGEAARGSAAAADAHYRRALSLRETGDLDGAVAAAEEASRAPALRFAAAGLLGRMFRERGGLPQAIEWFERAAEAPAPSPDDRHALLYDFAETLELAGETARALAVCLELQAEADGYRDVGARVDRLSKVQARG